ncbi:MAG: hypothetical protein M3N32_08490 [Actinomycetota bacterium]|nr:hypothetical protein [Actinomycetota bacterium]
MISAPRVLLSCVGENQPDWFQKMENLVLSVRRFGGSLADMPIVVNVVGGAESVLVRSMHRLDVEVRTVDAVDRRRPTANKFRMLELASRSDFDVLLAVDCDVIVKGDVAAEVTPQALRAAPADRDELSGEGWQRMFELLELPLPKKTCRMAVSGELTYPYFNSGVLFVPRELCLPLLEHWKRHLAWVLDGGAQLVGMKRIRDQFPLAAALVSAGLEVDALPVNLNLSASWPRIAKPYRHQWGPPFILHYHRLIGTDGFLLASPNGRINSELDEFNRARSEALGVPYSGLGTVPLKRRASAWLRTQRWYRGMGGKLRPVRRSSTRDTGRTGPAA